MATKELRVCDFCNKIIIGDAGTVIIGKDEYKEVCPNCIGRLGTFVKRLGTPYSYKKPEKKEEAPAAEPAPQTVIPGPDVKPVVGGGLLGRKK
jgi:hypothetical protein